MKGPQKRNPNLGLEVADQIHLGEEVVAAVVGELQILVGAARKTEGYPKRDLLQVTAGGVDDERPSLEVEEAEEAEADHYPLVVEEGHYLLAVEEVLTLLLEAEEPAEK